jgi:hypothetical protein
VVKQISVCQAKTSEAAAQYALNLPPLTKLRSLVHLVLESHKEAFLVQCYLVCQTVSGGRLHFNVGAGTCLGSLILTVLTLRYVYKLHGLHWNMWVYLTCMSRSASQ